MFPAMSQTNQFDEFISSISTFRPADLRQLQGHLDIFNSR